MNMNNLTPSQSKAVKEFKNFFNSTDTCICLSGKPGVGKTYFIKEVIQPLSHMRTVVTATTNKAAILLQGTTIHSALGIKVSQNQQTNTYKLDLRRLAPIHDSLVIIDEASMLEKELLDVILNNCIKCKIIFVGDKNQLPAIKCPADVFNKYPVVELTDVVRQKKQDLIDTIEEARQAIHDVELILPSESANVHIIDDSDLASVIKTFNQDDKILSFTNPEVVKFNQYYRQVNNLSPDFKAGDLVVAKNYCETPGRNKCSFFAEEVGIIEHIGEPHNLVLDNKVSNFMVRDVKIFNKSIPFYMPVNTEEYLKMVSHLYNTHSKYYFFFKENIADLRDIFSCTVHASQGSTYNKVLVNFDDIVKSRRGTSINTKTRLLYVALSRAKEEIYIYTKEYK